MSAVYKTVISTADRFVPNALRPLWLHPAECRSKCVPGPKTIFFWAPIGKWILVFAGLRDLNRPVEKCSTGQSVALMGTGFIWSRYSLVIKPKNWSLFAVNLTVGLTGLYQVIRIARHQPAPGADQLTAPATEGTQSGT